MMLSSNPTPISFSKLDKGELTQFTSIHEKLIPKRRKKMETYDIWENTSRVADKNKENYNLIQPILDKAERILNKNNVSNFDVSKYVIEFHQRNCGFEKKKYQWSGWHCDDGGARQFNCYSILFYLRKDKTIHGGDLEYKESGIIKKHIVSSGDILQFRGDLLHKPEATSGFGCRDIIVIFIKRTKR